MDLRDRSYMANLSEDDLMPLQLTLGLYIEQQMQLWSINESLKESCLKICRKEGLDESNLPGVVIKRIWKRLKETHKLRVVE